MSSRLIGEARKVIAGGGKRLRLRFDLAQKLSTPVGMLWLVSGASGVLCLFRANVSAGFCGQDSTAIRFGAVLEVYKRSVSTGRLHDFLAMGVAPDSAAAVEVRVGGKTTKLPVSENTFGYRADRPIRIMGLVR